MKIRWIGCLALSVVLYGCAGPSVEVQPLLQDFDRYQEDIRSIDAGPEALGVLQAGREKRMSAQSLLDGGKKKEAHPLAVRALADARLALDLKSFLNAREDAAACREQVQQARRKWSNAILTLEQTEDFVGRTTPVSRQAPAVDDIEMSPLPESTLDSAAAFQLPVDEIRARWESWREAATRRAIPAADLETQFLRHAARIQAEDAGEESRRHHTYLANRTLQSLEIRVRRHAAETVCRRAAELVDRFGDAREDALLATLELERSLQEDLRAQLDQIRAEARNRQNELFEALSQLEGKYARIRRDARGTIVSLADILFDFDKATLRRDVEFNLVKVATILNQFKEMSILIEGHTDSIGTEEYNLDLSKRRAKTVYDFLVSQDVAADRMSWEGYGESRPVADNGTEEGRQKNRRVDLVIRENP
ncbi:MAG: OmpA family protein [Candidatus Eisenbacteria bacterium]|nr:OmpA family protein [Candidatus Eisenbacteria bacterium]